MNQPIEELLIKKCRTDPYLTYPQFDRYLTGGQFKVINCLLRSGAAQGRAFPSNKRIAWEENLTEGSVRVIKSDLCKLGVLSKQEIKRGANTIWLYTVDTTWRREEYRAEFERDFNNREAKAIDTTFADEITALQRAFANAAPAEMMVILEKIKALTLKMQNSDQKSEKPTEKQENISEKPANKTTEKSAKYSDEFIDFIVSQKSGIVDENSYRAKIKKLLNNGEFEGLAEYKSKYKQKKIIEAIEKHIVDSKGVAVVNGVDYAFDGIVKWDDDNDCYIGYFGGYKTKIDDRAIKIAIEQVGSDP